MLRVTALLFLVVFCSCSSSKKHTEKAQSFNSVEEAAQSKLSGNISYIPNSENTYMLCTSKITKNLVTLTEFLVVKMSNNELINTPKGDFKRVSWNSSTEIKIEYVPGTPLDGVNEYSYLYDVVAQKRIKSTSNIKP